MDGTSLIWLVALLVGLIMSTFDARTCPRESAEPPHSAPRRRDRLHEALAEFDSER